MVVQLILMQAVCSKVTSKVNSAVFSVESLSLCILYVRLGTKLAQFHALLPGTMMFSLETMKSFERENVHSDDFLSTAVMSSLDEAMQSLEIGQETVQEPVTKTV